MDVAARHAQLSDQSIKPPAAQLSNNVPVTKRQRLIAAKSRGLDAACQKLKECAKRKRSELSTHTATAAKRMQDGRKLSLADSYNLHKPSFRGTLLRKELHAPAPTEDWHIPEAEVCISKGFSDGNYSE